MKKLSTILPYLLPRPRDILFFGVIFILALGGPRLFNNDGDLGRHITIGNYILNTGSIPTTDIFSNTMYGKAMVPHEWIAQIALALAHQAMGLSGNVLLASALAAFTILIVYDEMIRRGTLRMVALFVTAWVAMLSALHWLARPHMFTFFFLAIWTYTLERTYRGQFKKTWIFPLLMLVWANTHGAFIAGFVVWGAYFADWLWDFINGRGSQKMGKQLLSIGILSLAVTFLNPSGWHLWQTSVGYVGNDFLTGHTIEYLSPDFHQKQIWPFMFMIATGLFALAQGNRISLREALLFSGWAMTGLYSVRNIPLFAIVNAPLIASLIQWWIERIPRIIKRIPVIREREETSRGNLWISLILLGFGVLLWRGVPLDEHRTGNVFLSDKMPVQAMDWLAQHPQDGNMFNEFNWGGYILYRSWPDNLVFIDGQTDFYGADLTKEFLDISALRPGWEETLDKHHVSWVLIPSNEPLALELESTASEWKLLHEDSTASIFRRENTYP